LAQYARPIVNDLGVKVDADLKFDSQIKTVVKASFFKLRQLAKIKPFIWVSVGFPSHVFN